METNPSHDAGRYPYTPFFCEENIWHLADRLIAEGVPPDRLSVLVLGNRARQIPLFAQRAGRRGDGLVVWDYHVILHHRMEDGDLIYDYDSRLVFPCPFDLYRAETFPDPRRLPPELHLRVRVVPAAAWLREFHSDRSRMRDALGRPLKPFPPWPVIGPPTGQGVDLQEYLDMERELRDESRICGVEELEAVLGLRGTA